MSKRNKLLLGATGFIAASLAFNGCQSKAAPSGPPGSVTNPIDLTKTNPKTGGSEFEYAKTIARAYHDSNNERTITITARGLENMNAAYDGMFLKVQTGDDAAPIFEIRCKCANGVPALELTEYGAAVGSMIAEGSSAKPADIYNAPRVKKLYYRTDNSLVLTCQ